MLLKNGPLFFEGGRRVDNLLKLLLYCKNCWKIIEKLELVLSTIQVLSFDAEETLAQAFAQQKHYAKPEIRKKFIPRNCPPPSPGQPFKRIILCPFSMWDYMIVWETSVCFHQKHKFVLSGCFKISGCLHYLRDGRGKLLLIETAKRFSHILSAVRK